MPTCTSSRVTLLARLAGCKRIPKESSRGAAFLLAVADAVERLPYRDRSKNDLAQLAASIAGAITPPLDKGWAEWTDLYGGWACAGNADVNPMLQRVAVRLAVNLI